ncbi:MAG: hypothetical protein ACK46X_12430, partial [Candidatus Sericytochromatia bacterium]
MTLCTLLVACQATVGGPTVAGRAKKPTPTAASARPAAPPSGGPSATPAVPTTALAGLVKMDASTVVSAGGANVISAGGANVVSAGGANYRALAMQVAFGEMLPVSGVAVVAVSLRTGKPLGSAVLTDAEGRYKLAIPQSETGNVSVLAAVPGKSAEDPVLKNPRLRLETLASGGGAATDVLVDVDRAVVSRYIRRAFVGRMIALLDVETKDGSSIDNPLFRAVWERLMDEAIAAKSAEWPAERQRAVAERLADNLIYFVKLESAKVDVNGANWPDPKEETAFEAYADVLGRCRAEATARMAPPNEAYFDTQPFMAAHNQGRPADQQVKLRKPSEFGDFITDRYLTVTDGYNTRTEVFEALGLDRRLVNRLRAAEDGLMATIGITMVTNDKAPEAIIQLIRDETPDFEGTLAQLGALLGLPPEELARIRAEAADRPGYLPV